MTTYWGFVKKTARFWSYFGKIFIALGQIFIVVNGQNWTKHLYHLVTLPVRSRYRFCSIHRPSFDRSSFAGTRTRRRRSARTATKFSRTGRASKTIFRKKSASRIFPGSASPTAASMTASMTASTSEKFENFCRKCCIKKKFKNFFYHRDCTIYT